VQTEEHQRAEQWNGEREGEEVRADDTETIGRSPAESDDPMVVEGPARGSSATTPCTSRDRRVPGMKRTTTLFCA
jgi:hypothetical protein